MKILYAVNISFPMNVARSVQIVNTCHALAKQGNKILLLFGGRKTGKDPDTILKSYYNIEPVDTLTIKIVPSMIADKSKKIRLSWNGIYLLSCLFMFLYLRFTDSYDVLICRELKIAKIFLKFRRLIGIPVIYEAHDILFMAEQDSMEREGRLNDKNRKKVKSIRKLEQYIMHNAEAIITVNSIAKKMIKEEFDTPAPLFIIPNGTHIIPLSPENSGKYICYIGHLYKWKGVETLIEAMQYVNERLVIVGGKPHKKDIHRLKDLADTTGVSAKIKFTGFIPPAKVNKYRCNAKILVLPNPDILYNRYFTCPIKLFEYMASMKPVVASDLPAIREIATNNKNAVLVEPGNPEAMAEGIKKILNDKIFAEKIALQAYNDSKNYSWDMRAQRIVEMIGRIIHRRERGERREE